MSELLGFFVNVWLKFFFLLTPFFALTTFLSLTEGMSEHERRSVARRSTVAVVVTSFVIFFFGDVVFRLFGITLDSFRIGAGCLLFLSALALSQGQVAAPKLKSGQDPSVVPIAIPILVGPAVAGTTLVMAAECHTIAQKVAGFSGIVAAALCIGVILAMSTAIEKRLGRDVISILMKLTGLILAAFAAQIIFTGVRNMLFPG